jgi:hypothetical protein
MAKTSRYEVQVGMRFGRLVVESFIDGEPCFLCECQCDCGNKANVTIDHLAYGGTKSCGCLQKERARDANTKHGDSHSLLHNIWSAMKDRCRNSRNKNYPRYGARGIVVCDEWLGDYLVFRQWALENGYKDGLSIERNDNDGNYEPSNCSWIPLGQQRRNSSYLHQITAFGETKILQDWLKDPRTAVCRLTLYSRIKAGWDIETAITTPAQKKNTTPFYIRVKHK